MASSPRLSALSLLLLLFVMLLPIAQVTLAAGRPLPTTTNPASNKEQAAQSTPGPNHKPTEAHPDKKQTETTSTNPNSRSQTKTTAHKKQTETSSTNPNSGSQAKPSPDKKQTECLDHEGTVLIPGVGRYMIGTVPSVPTIGGTFLGDSVPAAMNGQYLPGNDDTFVPNPGYEVPNPFHGTSP